MIIDGRALAKTIQDELREHIRTLPVQPKIAVLMTQTDAVTGQFTRIKERIGTGLGVDVALIPVPPHSSTKEIIDVVYQHAQTSNGVIVQLPLPEHVDTGAVLDALPAKVDVDGIGSEAIALFEAGTRQVLPPVVSAMREILSRNNVPIPGQKVLVVGDGKLVGRPARVWFERMGAAVSIVTKSTGDISNYAPQADIIVLGAGAPGILTPNMIADGVVILDAGTSEAGGVVAGDADPACALKAKLFTPVPGGIGPIAVTMIYANMLSLMQEDRA